MDWIWNLLSFLVLLGVVVTVHEAGHFLVARLCGVRVLRFSIGFGRPLWRKLGRDGVEYQIGLLPLGGYVKMLDEREGDVPEAWAAESFNRASVWRRMAIVAAGPLANVVLAAILFWMSLVMGIPGIRPVVGEVLPASPAEQAGIRPLDEFRIIAGREVRSWMRVNMVLAEYMGTKADIEVTVARGGKPMELTVPFDARHLDSERMSPLRILGVQPWQGPDPGTVVGKVEDASPAFAAGVRVGDRLLRLDGQPLRTWHDLMQVLKDKGGQTVALEVERNGQSLTLSVTLAAHPSDANRGYLGVTPMISDSWREQMRQLSTLERFGFFEAAKEGVVRTWQTLALSFKGLAQLVQGHIPISHLSGPVGIAQGAGQSAQVGVSYFLNFMALISVSLAFLNVLPIPLLDGGHLLFYVVELLRGKPVSEEVQMAAMKVGLTLILALTVVAVFNDLNRVA
jgi:regulator of sigma E protease